MGRIRLSTIFSIFIGLLIILGTSVLHYPIVKFFERKAERKWNCEIEHSKANISFLRGMITFEDLNMRTAENTNPVWHLSVKDTILQIDYSELIKGNIIFKMLLLDTINLNQEEKEQTTSHERVLQSKRPQNGDKVEKTRKTTESDKKGILIKELQIRNGKFQYLYIYESGITNSVQTEGINIDIKNIVFSDEPNSFFKSVLKQIK